MSAPGADPESRQQSAHGTVTRLIRSLSTMEKRDKLLESDFFEKGPPRCCELLTILFADDPESAASDAGVRQDDPAKETNQAAPLNDADESGNGKIQEAL